MRSYEQERGDVIHDELKLSEEWVKYNLSGNNLSENSSIDTLFFFSASIKLCKDQK